MSLTVRYIYSACVVVRSPDTSVVCDPWFTPGAYDGSWFQYPPLGRDPAEVIGPADLVYISHIHPDHYDPIFLHGYLDRFPGTRLIIGHTEPPHLLNKMRVDGFSPAVIDKLDVGKTRLTIVPNGATSGVVDIDTALVVVHGDNSVVNLNDNPFDEAQVRRLLAICPGEGPTIALLPYAGAGPYPQTYEFPSEEDRDKAAARKQRQFVAQYRRYLAALKPSVAVPFAGKYWLGGPLSRLNSLRGIPDATELLGEGPTVVLADGGEAVLDAATLEATACRLEPYDPEVVQRYLDSIWPGSYDYEREICLLPGHQLPIVPLLRAAHENARAYSKVDEPYWFCLKAGESPSFLCVDAATDSGVRAVSDASDLLPRSEVTIDARYLFGLLTRLYHWNNAEIGSHYRVRRVPDVYKREAFAFLHRLHV